VHYAPLPSSAFESQTGHDLFQSCYEHISDLLGESWFPTSNASRIEGIAVPVMTVWRLWWFAAEVAGNGMSAWVLNCPPHAKEIIDSHSALTTVGALKLKQLLELAIPLAAEEGAEFMQEHERDWFLQFHRKSDHPDLASIDSMSFDLAADPLSNIVDEYMRANREHF
jgi:hypothetical protein